MRNGRTVISSEEAEVIREIFKAYLGGASLKSIAEELTARQIPYTQKTATWDKARIARIINNAKYVGTEEYDPIIDEDMYEAAVSLKTARQRNTCKKENDAIALLRDLVRCDCCGHPMKRQVSTKHRIRESWNCTNDECGNRVRISDAQLLETITILINRIILNNHLLQPKPRKRYEPDALVTKIGNEIALELEQDDPNEDLIIQRTVEMASLIYEQSSAKLDLAVSIARKLAQTMVTQEEFNQDYFTALTAYVTLGAQGRVVLHTKTETEVALDDGSN
jgi:recombinase